MCHRGLTWRRDPEVGGGEMSSMSCQVGIMSHIDGETHVEFSGLG